jgi:integrase
MTKRRAKGEGTLYQRKDKRWVGMYTVQTIDGRKKKAVYGTCKKEVRAKLTEAIANRDKGLVFDSGNLSVSAYLDKWLEAIQDSIGERTWKRHESIVRLHLKPAIGSTKLAVLSPLQVQSLYLAKSRTHLAPGSVKRIHTTLHKALKQAVRWQMIPRPMRCCGLAKGLQRRDKAVRQGTGEHATYYGQRDTAATPCIVCVGSNRRVKAIGANRASMGRLGPV